MKNKLIRLSKYIFALAFLPIPTFAAPCSSATITDFQAFVSYAICLLNSLVPLAFAIAVVLFVYGVLKYIAKADDEEARKKGRDFMIWSLVAIFVMVSIWGFVKLLQNTFKLDNSSPIVIPDAPTYP